LAVHPSALKRHRQSLKRKARNRAVKSRLRTLIKKTRAAVESRDREIAAAQLKEVNQALSKAVSKGILKRNTASRWLSRLSRSISRLAAPRTSP
jgi:small subunit ribosomal protein S20